jgi:hypothetical protein
MDVKIIGTGLNADVPVQVDQTHKAMRVSLRPAEKGILSSGRMALWSGAVAAGMTGPLPIWEMRWFPTDAIALVRRLKFMAMGDATAFAAGSCIFGLYRATGFTALDTTGAVTAPTIGANELRKSARQGATKLQSTTQAFAILNTAATGLTGGTKTLNSNAMAFAMGSVGAAPLMRICESELINAAEAGREPEELQTNEGLILRAELIAATGTWKFGVEVEWDEVDSARYFGGQN